MSGPNLPNVSLLLSIERLKTAIEQLPLSTPEGSSDGVVWQNFNINLHKVRGPIFEAINQAYTRCFSRIPGSIADPVDNILRGSYGMDVVVHFFEECARSPMLDSSALHLTELKVGQLTDLVYARIKSLPKDSLSNPTKKRQRAANICKRKSARSTQVLGAKEETPNSSSDSDFCPRSPSPESELDACSEESNTFENKLETSLDEERAEPLHNAHKRLKGSSTRNLTSEAQDGQIHVKTTTQSTICVGKKRGRDPVVREWAFAHHEKPVPSYYPNTNRPAWAFKCKYCPSVHHFPRTCDNVSMEKISATNLAGHLNTCKKLPAQYKTPVAKAQLSQYFDILTSAQQSLGEIFRSNKPISRPVALTPSVFRSTLIQGVVRDNHTLTFGEGKGMRQVFTLVAPELRLPVHSTMRKDLSKLYEVLSARVQQVLNAQKSRFAITSDAWTSKSFIYSLGGVVITFIDQSWNLQEFVLDIVNLRADHTGAGMGRKIFASLDQSNAARNIIASVTDNASNNRTLNSELAARLSKKYGYQLNVDLMSIICLCHALHLVCSAILSNLKAMDNVDDVDPDQYALVKSFDAGEIFEDGAEILEEEERLLGEEDISDIRAGLADGSDEEGDDSETIANFNNSESLSSQPNQNAFHSELNCVQKVHCITVDITSSALRRRRMRDITRKLGIEQRAVITSVRVRWNSILAEIRRAVLLKAAINQYVLSMDKGKRGASLRRARALKKKWTLTDEEWDALEELVRILEPFECATQDYSRRGRAVLHSVLPTYAVLRDKLIESRNRLTVPSLGSGVFESIIDALKAGEDKLEKYFNLAVKSDLTLLASILHPAMRLAYLQDTRRWGTLGRDLVRRGQELLEYLYELYKLEQAPSRPDGHSEPHTPLVSNSGWIDSVLVSNQENNDLPFPEEVRNYLDGKYRYKGGDILMWWKDNEPHLPVLSRIARDILAVPATSVSVERLFSRCKLVMNDYRNMSFDTARQLITCQQWLEAGLGVDLPDFVSNDCN
ncbi:similar to zinc finger protein [Rhizoctonia solani AG-1 IB]|uniref:Similar to zinc finger protein n=1 Tax=Thanatephorus cucumeris (strain AG1-IB / isolate 7/3/14) TaxID=1108050 RepID=A0A0B7FMM6_THACB|nr:similar to zinc finger protein [Rhizoctonia solani AG-1 IB]